jgi:hypothetical protein
MCIMNSLRNLYRILIWKKFHQFKAAILIIYAEIQLQFTTQLQIYIVERPLRFNLNPHES